MGRLRGRSSIAILLMVSGLTACRGEERPPEAQPSLDIPKTAWWKQEAGKEPVAAENLLAKPMLPAWAAMAPVVADEAREGADLFENKGCVSCHSIGKGQVVGPDLQGITRRAEPDWVKRFLANPDTMLESDPRAKELLAKYAVKMPNLNLSQQQIDELMAYLRQRDLQATPKGR